MIVDDWLLLRGAPPVLVWETSKQSGAKRRCCWDRFERQEIGEEPAFLAPGLLCCCSTVLLDA
jgi:hypothetical protein